MKRLAIAAMVLGALGLATVVVLRALPAEEFIITPDRAKPLADKVKVEGGRREGRGGVYYVDVFVRRTSLLERLFPFTRPDGSTVLPEHALLPEGTTEAERNRQNAADMARSERIAAVVALRALGREVVAVPRGALVIDVSNDVPAAAKIDPGDVIVAVDGVKVRTPTMLRREIARRSPGDDVRLSLRRDGKLVDLTVRTVRSASDPSRPLIGITVDQDARIELPLDIDIDLGRVGGPSAGLPFALEIVRMLGSDVTHGCRVAATGELALDGTVLPVGGVEQKAIGARRTDVDFFVVPSGENAVAARMQADGIQVVPVESFQQALRKLTTSAAKC